MSHNTSHQRVGDKFRLKIHKIIDLRKIEGKTDKRETFPQITNIIVRHKLWPEIEKSILESSNEEVNKFGK